MSYSTRLKRASAAAVFALCLSASPAAVAAVAGPAHSGDSDLAGATTAPRAAAKKCSLKNKRPFVPTKVAIGKITAGAKVVAANRAAGDVPGTAPITDAGKNWVAWDKPGIQPASARGHVLMNAHAWPDGTALGNKMSKSLKKGALIKVYGKGGRVQCYKVSSIQIAAPTPAFSAAYFGSHTSPAMLGLLTCSGVRTGPGHWSMRTVWWAKPVK